MRLLDIFKMLFRGSRTVPRKKSVEELFPNGDLSRSSIVQRQAGIWGRLTHEQRALAVSLSNRDIKSACPVPPTPAEKDPFFDRP